MSEDEANKIKMDQRPKQPRVPQISFLSKMLKHRSQYGRSSLWKKDGSSKGFEQLFRFKGNTSELNRSHRIKVFAHFANETAPTPFASKGFHSLVVVPNGLLASFTLWQSKADMTRLAVWMASKDGEPFKVAVTAQCKFA